jgi:hypothetical protein
VPQLVVTSNESSGSGGIPTGTGTAFVAGTTDAGPPPSGALYVKCQSLTDFVNAFGPRSSTSAKVYDWLDEFFNEGGSTGKVSYVTRVTDQTATTAALTLNDGQGTPKPTVVVSALTAGTEGNNTAVAVAAGTAATFTANTATSTALANVSSFKNIGVGTPVTGAGIPANTYIASVNTGAGTATLSQAATSTATAVVITPGTVTLTVIVTDASGNQIANETHGPYATTAQLFADATSTWVTFTQSAGSGFTQNLPAALTSAALTGGADASDLTDASHVAALANFPSSLGVGTVSLPGKATVTAWQGIRDHCNATNRWGVLDQVDASSSAAANSQVSGLPTGDWTRCFFIQGSLLIPALPGAASRTVAGSAAVAALAAQVAQTPNQAQAPAGQKWPLTYAQGFTEFFGPLPATGLPAGAFSQADVNAMQAAGINCFANFYGTLCLFGFVTPVSSSQDPVYDQATAARERMALVNDCQIAMAPYLFDDINLATIENETNDLNAVCLGHYSAGALYDGGTGQAAQAFQVTTAAPVNTPQTAQAKQLNAKIAARIVRYADTVNTTITVIPVTVSLPSA